MTEVEAKLLVTNATRIGEKNDHLYYIPGFEALRTMFPIPNPVTLEGSTRLCWWRCSIALWLPTLREAILEKGVGL